jgi:OOP family OmpA-OmpF porin
VLAAADRCPTEAGPADNNGCPDPDTDGDGVVDRLDQCPTEKGSAADRGCAVKPMAEVKGDRIDIVDRVYFKTNSAVIEARSYTLLDDVAKVIVRYGLTKVRVAGHTDDVGVLAKNMALSQRRAEAVVKYLVGKGVPASVLEAQGFGPTRPLAPNDSLENRASNRRVEFVIGDARIQDAGSKPSGTGDR